MRTLGEIRNSVEERGFWRFYTRGGCFTNINPPLANYYAVFTGQLDIIGEVTVTFYKRENIWRSKFELTT